ncbi:Fe-only nitrogenase accessory protein AnfO [Clostridium estertheticum]|uniref:Fe-only nitrogenase accessory protein AnfO n=1 Tax=Clostridium estertheticum TaxID=238834 RepID=UPI001CF32048|nr:Fe-only nitrogenase accessory protein AnfO [Clostridium estertheticum]MCB2357569.1 Fe-only nitrogenase accessory protein AnfO [Clostridium estertheticum]
MGMEIAVFLGENGETISFNQSGVTKLYLKEKSEWKVIKEIIFEINDLMSTETIRDNVKNMADALGECKVFVAGDVKGLPYTILDNMGFNLLKVEGTPEGFLELVLKGEEERKLKKQRAEIIPRPSINGKEGHYFIDIQAEMEDNEELTSKQLLLPFINNTEFKKLEIICTHVPLWFGGEFSKLNLSSDIEKINDGTMRVKVYSHNISTTL